MLSSSIRSVKDNGARGDGLGDDSEAIQRTLDRGPGAVVVPPGHYLIGRGLRIGSGIHLRLEPGAHFRLADGAARSPGDYLLSNANPGTGDADVTVEGGFWDGNNRGNPRPPGLFDFGYTGAMLHFRNVRGLRIQQLRLHDAEAYHLRLTQVRGFHVEGLRFSADNIRPNNDGVHIGGACEEGVIRDIRGLHPGVTGDDLVALNADDALTRTEVNGMTNGPIRDLLIEDLAAEDCHTFIRLLSVVSPIERIRIRGVRGTCAAAAINADAARGCRVPLFDEKNPPFPDGVGRLAHISASDFVVAKSLDNDIPLLRLETRMAHFSLGNLRRDRAIDRAPGTPTLCIRHTALRSVAINTHALQTLAADQALTWNEDRLDHLQINPADED